MKKIVALMLVIIMSALCLTACGGEAADNGVKIYTVEAKFNSETVNQWKNIYLIDEDNYVLTVYAVDSKDATKTTADFYMAGKYTLDGNTLTLEPGYGYTYALNGDTPIEMPVSEGGAMYAAMMGTTGYTYTLLEDGSFEVVE